MTCELEKGSCLTVDQPEGIFGIEPDFIRADPDNWAILFVYGLPQKQHTAIPDLVCIPAIGDGSEAWTWNAGQRVEVESVDGDGQ